MASFEFNPIAQYIIFKWKCPNCGHENISDTIVPPKPNFEAETHHDSVETDWCEESCSKCGKEINITLNCGFYGGDGDIDIDDCDFLNLEERFAEEDDYYYDKELFKATHSDVIDTLNAIEGLPKERKSFLYKLLYANIITSMETFLADRFINYVISSDSHLKRFTENYEPFKKEPNTFTLSKIYTKYDNLKDYVKSVLNSLLFHDLPKIKPIIFATTGIDIGDIKEIYKAVLIRHDIVHRNGKDKNGIEHNLTKESVESLNDLVNEFIYDIDSKFSSAEVLEVVDPKYSI